ncbi:hypothetical protein, partial [Segatella oulorum]|uniref:hypothetical protein n=1 Tax=Segatella oulorum TaxID=28136 RepID=UPI0023F3DBFF
FQPCWNSSSPIFFFFGLAGTPATPFFSFLALLELQQPRFLLFQPCWNSSSPIFFIFSLAGTPAALALPSPFNIKHKKAGKRKSPACPK